MKKKAWLLGLALLLVTTIASACEVEQKRRAQSGVREGFSGICSNNGGSIECFYDGEGSGIECSGPEGTNTGDQLRDIIYSVCGCRQEDIQQDQMNQAMEGL